MTVADACVVIMAGGLVAYVGWRYLIAAAIGRTAGAIDRRRRPVTEQERRAIIDERAARDSLRPYGSVEGLSTIDAPIVVNGHRETYESDPAA